MEAIGYGILIAALMGLSAFAAAWLVLRLKSTPDWRTFKIYGNNVDDDSRVEEEIRKGFNAFNLEEPPGTPSAMGRRFTRTHSEELRRVPK